MGCPVSSNFYSPKLRYQAKGAISIASCLPLHAAVPVRQLLLYRAGCAEYTRMISDVDPNERQTPFEGNGCANRTPACFAWQQQ